MSATKAAAELWRLAQSHEVIRCTEAGCDVPLDHNGKIKPSRESLDAAHVARADLVRLAGKWAPA
jgi:sialic acid synthase SpsE